MTATVNGKVRFGPFEVNLHTGELSNNGTRIHLQPQPLQVLAILLENPGRLVTREEFRKRLWDDDTFVDFEHSLNTDIKKLRQALGDEAETPRYIETLPKRGYRLLVTAESQDRNSSSPVVLGAPTVPLKRKTIRWKWAIALVMVLPLVVMTALVARVRFQPPPRIVDSVQLTHTQLQKSRSCAIATDGSRVYFQERRAGDRWGLSQVAVTGGEVAEIPVPWMQLPCLRGMSPSGTSLLILDTSNYGVFELSIPAANTRPFVMPGRGNFVIPVPGSSDVLFSDMGDKEMVRLSSDGKTRTHLFDTEDITFPSVSPDGSRIRWSSIHGSDARSFDIWEANIDGKNVHPVLPGIKGAVAGKWSYDGKLYFFERIETFRPNSLWVMRETSLPFGLGRSQPVQLFSGPIEVQAWTPSTNSKELYAVGSVRRGELSIFNPQSSKFEPFLNGISACYVTYSPDRRWIAYVSYPDGSLWKSRTDGTEKMQLTFPPIAVVLPRWSPDGKFIAFMAINDVYRSIYFVKPDGGRPRPLLSGEFSPSDPTWSPDSQSIIYGGTWNISDRRSTHIEKLDLLTMKSEPIPESEGLWSPRLSPDGRFIVAHTNETAPKLKIYSVSDKEWKLIPGGKRNSWEAWSHDSKYVYTYDVTSGAILRVNIDKGSVETVVNMQGVSWTAYGWQTNNWFGLTPDDRIMVMRDIGISEIYTLKLDY